MRCMFRLLAAGSLAAASLLAAAAASAATYTAIHDFCTDEASCDGRMPNSKLVFGPDGSAFGTTFLGGVHAQGVAFRLVRAKHARWKTSVIHEFCAETDCIDGANPTGLIAGDDGSLYGTAMNGGAHGNAGVAFKLTPNKKGTAYKYSKLYDFCAQPDCADGAHPKSHLSYAGAVKAFYDGKSPLYGITGASNGAVFVLEKGKPWRESVAYKFCALADCADGAAPAEIFYDAVTTSIYGVATNGGPLVDGHGYGVIFQLLQKKSGWKQSVRHVFCAALPCTNGAYPQSLMIAASGNAFGTTGAGGDADKGTAFVFQAGPGNFSRWYSFCFRADCTDGAYPVGAAVDPSGSVFITTAGGGDPETPAGVLIQFVSGIASVLHTFCSDADCADGGQPQAGPTIGNSGEILGTTTVGGAGQNGTAFLLTTF